MGWKRKLDEREVLFGDVIDEGRSSENYFQLISRVAKDVKIGDFDRTGEIIYTDNIPEESQRLTNQIINLALEINCRDILIAKSNSAVQSEIKKLDALVIKIP